MNTIYFGYVNPLTDIGHGNDLTIGEARVLYNLLLSEKDRCFAIAKTETKAYAKQWIKFASKFSCAAIRLRDTARREGWIL